MSNSARSTVRKAANLSIDATLLSDAKDLDINVSRAAEVGIAKAVADEKARLWLEENRQALQRWNEYIEDNGLPLANDRSF